MSDEPLSPLGDGRDEKGHFLKGNPGGPGNPNAKAVAAWRQTLLDAATPERMRAVMDRLFQAAEAGEAWAVREVLDRCLGRPVQAIVTEDEAGERQAFTPIEVIRLVVQQAVAPGALLDRGIPGVGAFPMPSARRDNGDKGKTGDGEPYGEDTSGGMREG